MVEHLVQEFQDKSAMQEFSHSFTFHSPPSPSFNRRQSPKSKRSSSGNGRGSNIPSRGTSQAILMESKLQEFEIEMERLCSRMEHLKAQNEVLTLSLDESKTHCENMAVLLGKYESNLIAYGLVMSYSDQVIESLETLEELLEAQLECAVVNQEKMSIANPHQNSQKVGNSIKQMIAKLQSTVRSDSGLAEQSNASNDVSNIRYWQESSGCSQNTRLCFYCESKKKKGWCLYCLFNVTIYVKILQFNILFQQFWEHQPEFRQRGTWVFHQQHCLVIFRLLHKS